MTGAFAANVQFRIFVTMNRQTNIRLFSLLLTICTALGCGCAARPQGMIQPQPQPQKRMIQEPVRFEDGTPVSDEKDAEALFEKDPVQADTTFAENGDTLITMRHTGAFMRIQLEGLPTDAGIDHILLVPMRGEAVNLPVTVPASGPVVIWQAKTPGWLRPAAAIASTKDGRIWSARLKGQTLLAGTAHRWDATVVTPEAPAPGLTAKVLSSTALPDIEAGEYSGITWLAGNNYAVVDNDQKGGGILHFTIPIDNSGYVGEVSMRPAAGTVVSTDKNRDNEGITYVPSLGTLYVSSERHQEIREYDLAGRATGKALQIPSDLSVKAITSNRGFEALTFNNATPVLDHDRSPAGQGHLPPPDSPPAVFRHRRKTGEPLPLSDRQAHEVCGERKFLRLWRSLHGRHGRRSDSRAGTGGLRTQRQHLEQGADGLHENEPLRRGSGP